MTVYAVAETHLLGIEEPPIHPQWHWAGTNRGPSGRKGGGIGVLWRAVDRGHNVGNMHIMHCIREDVSRWATGKEVLLLGDFNGHIQPLDGFQDRNGELLLQTAQDLSLEGLNLRPDCEGEFTWCARASRSCIDYVLASHKLAQRVQHVHIDESGQFSASSDNNRIKVTFTASIWRYRRREQREPSRRYLPASAYEAVARDFEIRLQVTPPRIYEQYVGELRRIMHAHEIRSNSRGGVRRNGWWDGEVKAALDARKVANRQHRAAVTAALPSNVCQDLWDQYLAHKRTMQQVVQRKIATHDHAQLRSMTTAGRQGGRKFWAYVSTLYRKPAPPEIRDETTGEPVSDIPEHLTRHMAQLYDTALPTATEEHYAMSAPRKR
ncbi:hypothetical protein HPB49_003068 [Dermacentor silvarum]|uniref:Uncharacterized protein n=1 Tax=Dermacentor silvarum TaxID=543639 RepID=A0ACB8D2E8_DERSI|nr:hypothetical protein HPB49_003068 [Dermacentor silvarum]